MLRVSERCGNRRGPKLGACHAAEYRPRGTLPTPPPHPPYCQIWTALDWPPPRCQIQIARDGLAPTLPNIDCAGLPPPFHTVKYVLRWIAPPFHAAKFNCVGYPPPPAAKYRLHWIDPSQRYPHDEGMPRTSFVLCEGFILSPSCACLYSALVAVYADSILVTAIW